MDYMNIDNVKSLISDISNRKFQIIKGSARYKFTDKILKDPRYKDLRELLDDVYIKQGYGIKYLIKTYNFDITFPSFRHLIIFLPDIELHSDRIATDALRKQRSENLKKQYKEKKGWFKPGIQESIKHRSDARGVQGYYWNESKQKYVWLRSSWEYSYARWLNKQHVNWDVECRSYRLKDNHLYRPDFFIFDDNNNLIKIVEIKGYWKRDEYKPKLLNEDLNDIDVIIIDNIKPYQEKKDVETWKNIRKLKLNE